MVNELLELFQMSQVSRLDPTISFRNPKHYRRFSLINYNIPVGTLIFEHALQTGSFDVSLYEAFINYERLAESVHLRLFNRPRLWHRITSDPDLAIGKSKCTTCVGPYAYYFNSVGIL